MTKSHLFASVLTRKRRTTHHDDELENVQKVTGRMKRWPLLCPINTFFVFYVKLRSFWCTIRTLYVPYAKIKWNKIKYIGQGQYFKLYNGCGTESEREKFIYILHQFIEMQVKINSSEKGAKQLLASQINKVVYRLYYACISVILAENEIIITTTATTKW